MIEIFDNYFNIEDIKKYYSYYIEKDFYYGEYDEDPKLLTGLIHNIKDDEYFNIIHETIQKKILSSLKIDKKIVLYRSYLNLFLPNEKPYYHIDDEKECLSIIMYLTEGDDGETLFKKNNNTLHGVLPILGRVIVFDGRIRHKATTHRDKARLNLVLKYDYIS